MNKQTLITFIIVIFIIFVFITVFSKKKQQNQSGLDNANKPSVSPTKIQIQPRDTGLIIDISDKEKMFSSQKQGLMEKLPLQMNEFAVTFDYVNDKFIVSLTDPKDKNKNFFMNWLKNNYPVLTLTEFVVK